MPSNSFLFRFRPVVWWTSTNCYHGCHAREDSFPIFQALGGTCPPLSCFCNILQQDLTQLHVKITRSMNLLSVCWRTRKLSTCLHTVRYNHISFLNTLLQLISVHGSSGFYLETSRIISRSAGYKISSVVVKKGKKGVKQ